MAKFQFRLKTLLSMRESERDFRRAQLAEALLAEAKLDERRAQLERELSGQRSAVRAGGLPGHLDVDRLLAANRYDLVLRAELAVIARHKQELQIELDRRRQAVVAAEREVRVLEKLREKQREQFRQKQAAAEMKTMDEIAGRRAVPEDAAI